MKSIGIGLIGCTLALSLGAQTVHLTSSGVFENLQGNNSDSYTIDSVVSIGLGTDSLDLGTRHSSTDQPNKFRFTGNTVTTTVKESFKIGDFEYTNGTTTIGTNPDKFDLRIRLDFGAGEVKEVVYTFDLVSTPNTSDPQASADIVTLLDTFSSIPVRINGIDYYLRLEFGNTTVDGFSQVDRFFVLEDASASAEVIGYFTDERPIENGMIFPAVGIRFATEEGVVYQVQRSLDGENWTNFKDPVSGTGEMMEVFDEIPPKAFYRVEIQSQ